MEKRIETIYRTALGGSTSQVRRNRAVVPPLDFDRHSPFLLLMEDWFDASGGFETHPHRGFQTVTLVLDGELEHRDHTGAHGVLARGDVQWMTAGRGALHSEMSHGGGVTHTLQLWLNLPARDKMSAPSYRDQRLADAPVFRLEGGAVRVYAGTVGDVAHEHGSVWPLVLLDVSLQAGHGYRVPVPASYRGFFYLLAGAAHLGADREMARAGDVAWFEPAQGDGSDTLTIEATAALRGLVYASPPIDEPVAAYGPFVMNTMREVQQAFADYHAGRLVESVT
ncbi:MAG TPA: pirin family protein [Burkholderiaceae bacterium]|nr:pirin family protein [Burkholderiaceae bacterium]